jgi:DNA integrity scanning protein DisA with diadenylate cyclase activity
MSDPAYPAARAVAARVQRHFSDHLAVARRRGRTDVGADPESGDIEALIDAAFWASLRREEGVTPTISLALASPDLAGQAIHFAADLPLRAAALAKVAAAVERPGIHLGVWRRNGELGVWGTTRQVPAFCVVVEVVASGLLVIKYRNDPIGKFVNVALLEGDQIKIVDEGFSTTPDCPGPVKSLLGIDTPAREFGRIDVLVELSASMRAHRRGGALLVVPADSAAWRESIVHPILYEVDPPFAELADLVGREVRDAGKHEWQEDLRRSVAAIAGLTAVDGATIVTDRYEVIAFGTKITRRHGSASIERVLVTEPVEGAPSEFVAPVQLGGTRHLSAAQFVQDQRDAIALVASQDGRFTIFKWDAAEQLVHAHRVEALLI